jgi:hypothetical protein
LGRAQRRTALLVDVAGCVSRMLGRGMETRRNVIALALAGFAGVALAARAFAAKDTGLAGMTEEHFWAIVAESTRYTADRDRQTATLRASLEKLSPSELEDFEHIFDEQMHRSYSWDLWGAAYVIQGGASDDGFEYFRRWLISQGRDVFDRANADPDSLAAVAMPDSAEDREFEEFAYLALDIWGEKTGRDPGTMPNAAKKKLRAEEPSGVRFTEDPVALKKRYPKLWARFGGAT